MELKRFEDITDLLVDAAGRLQLTAEVSDEDMTRLRGFRELLVKDGKLVVSVEGGGGGGGDLTLGETSTTAYRGDRGKAAYDHSLITGANPHGITPALIGLGNVDNTSDANKPISSLTQTALNAKAPLASPTFTGTVSGITKAMVGLGNVDNTSDLSKPVSTATQNALNALGVESPSASSLVKRSSAGTVKTDTAVDGDDAINLTQFNGLVEVVIDNSTDTFTSTPKIMHEVTCTQAEYDGIGAKDANTRYTIIG